MIHVTSFETRLSAAHVCGPWILTLCGRASAINDASAASGRPIGAGRGGPATVDKRPGFGGGEREGPPVGLVWRPGQRVAVLAHGVAGRGMGMLAIVRSLSDNTL
jgi:hypothetical protein